MVVRRSDGSTRRTLLVVAAAICLALLVAAVGSLAGFFDAGDQTGAGSGGGQGGVAGLSAAELAAQYERVVLDRNESEFASMELAGRFRAFLDERGGLVGAIEDLDAAAAAAEQPDRYLEARRGIGEGDVSAAQEIFREIRDAEMMAGEAGNAEAARAAGNIGALIFYEDPVISLEAYKEAALLDSENPELWLWLGHIMRWTGQLDTTVTLYETGLGLAVEAERAGLIAGFTSNLGHVYRRQGLAGHAAENYVQAASMEEDLGNKARQADLYVDLADIYISSSEIEWALTYLSDAARLYEETGQTEKIADTYGRMGQMHMTQGNLEQANENLARSLAAYEELGLTASVADRASDLGIVHWTLGDLDAAAEFLSQSLALNEALGRTEEMAAQHGNLGLVFDDRGDGAATCEHWRLAETLYGEAEVTDLAEFYVGLLEQTECE